MDGIYILKTFTSWYSIGLNRLLSEENYKADSDNSDVHDVFDDLKDYTLNDTKTLWIDKSTCQVTESLVPLTEDEPISENSIDAFLGIVEVMNTYHLGVVTRSEVVAELDLGNIGLNKSSKSKIMTIKEVKFLPIRSQQEVTCGIGDVFSFDAALSPSTNIMGSNNLPNLATVMNSVNTVGDGGQYQMQEEVFKVLENMEKILTTGYYYSYDTDLTNTLQSLYIDRRVPLRRMMSSIGKPGNLKEEDLMISPSKLGKFSGREDRHNRRNVHSTDGSHKEYEKDKDGRKELLDEIMERNKVLYEVSKKDFNWGYKISHVLPKRWKTVLIQGYVGYRISYLNEEKIETLIIGRRNLKRSGTRYLARGIDEEGNVGNFVETEVRLRINEENWYSYTQHRGSVPVFWEQMNVTAPVMLYNYHHNIRSFTKHVNVLNECYRPNEYQLYVNLLDVKENEKVLTDSFMNVVDDYNIAQGFAKGKSREKREIRGGNRGLEGETSSASDYGLGESDEEPSRKDGSKRGMIELVNYNYNVNAKWSTHEIIVKYILEELNQEFNNIGYFDEEKYLENFENKGIFGSRKRNFGERSGNSSVIGSVSSKRSSRVGSGSESSDDSISSGISLTKYGNAHYSSSEELNRIVEESRDEFGENLLERSEYKNKITHNILGRDKDDHELGEGKEGMSSGNKRSSKDKELEGKRGLQRGILRTNCLDCLDRTNIFQWISSWVVVNKIMNNRTSSSTGGTSILITNAEVNMFESASTTDVNFNRLKEMLLTPEGVIKEENTLFTTFTDMWCDHGDAISIHYSGTPSTLSERVKETNTSLTSLFHYSKTMVQRLYHSLFQDNQRQAVFNILSPYTLTASGTSQREQEELLLLDPVDVESKEPEQERPQPEKPEGRHFSRASGVASRVAQKVDQVVRGARERRLLNTKYYIQDPFDAQMAREGAGSFTSGHESTSSTGKGFEVPYSSGSEGYADSSRGKQSRTQGIGYPTARSALDTAERGKQQGLGTNEGTDSIFDKLQKEIMNKLTIKSPILSPTDVGTKGVPDLKLLKQQREQLEEEYEEVEDMEDELEENLLKTEFARKSLDHLKIWIGSWNIGAHTIDVNKDVLDWMELKKTECDLYVFSFQEFVELNFINIATGRTDENKEYEFEYFVENMFKLSTSNGYEKVTSISMTGLYLVIFVKRTLKPHIRDLLITNVKTGLNYNIGNKGSVGIQFNLFDYTLSFLNMHLNFGKNLNVGRIELLEYILKNAFKEFNKNVLDNDIFILGGDFNFQVQLEKQVVLNLLKKMEYAKLLNYDEFNMARMIGIPVMNKLHEAEIQFQPTYKYKDGTKYYTTKRSPAWCDRIIFGGRLFESRKISILSYKRNDNLMISDHRPVSSIILVDLK
ncbi:phosphoinositide 5-phosphatase [Theileria orientalis]|uniref:phosphoinositide 5-phosphatase n=1 Tax=Theileria orientalis TaxID=68886 RepID=A0A976MCI2_THEOR|nr:phosphoinositide 5-phosphatase [Theileria orientalis]